MWDAPLSDLIHKAFTCMMLLSIFMTTGCRERTQNLREGQIKRLRETWFHSCYLKQSPRKCTWLGIPVWSVQWRKKNTYCVKSLKCGIFVIAVTLYWPIKPQWACIILSPGPSLSLVSLLFWTTCKLALLSLTYEPLLLWCVCVSFGSSRKLIPREEY